MAVSINLSEIDEMKRLTTESSSKVQIVAAAHKTLSHLPQRPAVDLAFVDLNYRVREGRSNSEYISVHSFFLNVSLLRELENDQQTCSTASLLQANYLSLSKLRCDYRECSQ